MRDFDSSVGDRLGEIRHRRIILQFSDNPFMGEELAQLDAEEAHLVAVHKWFNVIVSAVLDNATKREVRRLEGWREIISYVTPLDIFDKYSRLGGNRPWRLQIWINELVKDGMLDLDFAKTLDLKEPVNEQQKQKEEQIRRFKEGKAALLELVKAQGKKRGNTWCERQFNTTFSELFNSGNFTPDDHWLDLFKKRLVDRGLLPTGFDRAKASIVEKVKELVTL